MTTTPSEAPPRRGSYRNPLSPEEVELPSAARLRALKLSPEVAYYVLSRGYDLPTVIPQHRTPEPRRVKGARFDPAKVDKVLRAFHALRHTQGALAGQPLDPDGWQVAHLIAPVFGWVRQNDAGRWVRIVRSVWLEVPRKNGKSTISGGLAMYLTAGDDEPGAQVLAAATTKDQAGFVFAPIKKLAESAPALRGRVKPYQSKIVHPRTGSYFQVVSSAADAQHGANIHGAIVDEVHLHKKPDLIDAIETGTGSREQPLIVLITTADEGRRNTIYSLRRRYIEQLDRKVLEDPATFGVVFAAPAATKGNALFSDAALAAANPGVGASPSWDYLRNAAKKAQNSPTELARYKRLHLGLRTKQTTAFLATEDWNRNAGPRITPAAYYEQFGGRLAYGGLDLGAVSDLTALAWLFPREHDEGVDTLYRFWTPEDNLAALDARTAGNASAWADAGWLTTTPGNVTDYEAIRRQIAADYEAFDVETIGHDKWNATDLANRLYEQNGIPLVKVTQGFFTQSPALKEIQRLTKKGTRAAPMFAHGGNPVMAWCVDNLAVAEDAAGNVKPDKANSGEKIDGVSAAVNAMSELLVVGRRPETSRPTGLLLA